MTSVYLMCPQASSLFVSVCPKSHHFLCLCVPNVITFSVCVSQIIIGSRDTQTQKVMTFWDTQTQKVMTFNIWTEGHNRKKKFLLIKIFSCSTFPTFFSPVFFHFICRCYILSFITIGQAVLEKNDEQTLREMIT